MVKAFAPQGPHHSLPIEQADLAVPGDDLTDAYITLSGTGQLVKTKWKRPGLKLEY